MAESTVKTTSAVTVQYSLHSVEHCCNLIYDRGVIIENIYTNAAMSCQLPACTLSYDSYTDSYWLVVGVAHHVPLSVRESVDRVSRKKFQGCYSNMYR
jgi:hypothetical protein